MAAPVSALATPGALGGWIVALLLGLFTLLTQMRKARVDESAIVLAKWKELVESHDRDLAAMREELRAERQENTSLRAELRKAESEIRALKEEVAGLRRLIAQLGQSTLLHLDTSSVETPATDEAVRRREQEP